MIWPIILALFVLGSLCFLGWALWSLFWHLYDEHMMASKRIQNSRHDAAFHIPACYRDKKGVTK